MKLIACYSVFNEEQFLRASLSLIEPFVDKIWLVDGPYANFAHDEDHSTDLTLEIISNFKKRFPDKVELLASCVFANQIVKRNRYLKRAKQGDWLFIIDGDELPWGNLHQLKALLLQEKYLVVNVFLQQSPLLAPVPLPRLIHKVDGMEYKEHHAQIDFRGENILESTKVNIKQLYPVYLIHLNNYQSEKRQQQKDYYFMYEKFVKDEKEPWQLSTGDSWKNSDFQGVNTKKERGKEE